MSESAAKAPRIVRVALTETCNVYRPMPPTVARLGELRGHLEAVRNANIEHHLGLIDRAADAGAQLVGMGELCTSPYFALAQDPMWLALAEDAASGPTITAFRERARARQLILVAPIFEVEATTGRRFNTAVLIDERGEILGKYRKTHIPEGRNEQNAFHESFYYGASDGQLGAAPGLTKHAAQNPFFPVFETSVGRVGVLICYDRHFEGVVRTLAAGGAELILAPAITFGATSRRMWRLEAEVDAMRHRVCIGASNRLGSEPPWNQEFFGDSFFCGPAGPIMPLSSCPPGLVIGDLDLGLLAADSGSGWALNRDKRPDIYSR